VLDEDATRILARMSTTSRACRALGLWRTKPTHRQTGSTTRQQTAGRPIRWARGKHYTAADCRPTNQVSAWQALHGSRLLAEKLPTHTTRMSTHGHPQQQVVRVGEDTHEGATWKTVPWNLSLIAQPHLLAPHRLSHIHL